MLSFNILFIIYYSLYTYRRWDVLSESLLRVPRSGDVALRNCVMPAGSTSPRGADEMRAELKWSSRELSLNEARLPLPWRGRRSRRQRLVHGSVHEGRKVAWVAQEILHDDNPSAERDASCTAPCTRERSTPTWKRFGAVVAVPPLAAIPPTAPEPLRMTHVAMPPGGKAMAGPLGAWVEPPSRRWDVLTLLRVPRSGWTIENLAPCFRFVLYCFVFLFGPNVISHYSLLKLTYLFITAYLSLLKLT